MQLFQKLIFISSIMLGMAASAALDMNFYIKHATMTNPHRYFRFTGGKEFVYALTGDPSTGGSSAAQGVMMHGIMNKTGSLTIPEIVFIRTLYDFEEVQSVQSEIPDAREICFLAYTVVDIALK